VRGYKILVVEDDHGLREVLARGLRADEFEVITAASGASALRVDCRGVDAIVLDIGLPDSDGRDVCQALRTRGEHAPVIMLTARREVCDRLAGFAAGADDYLVKPFAIAELIARLAAVLRRRSEPSGSSRGDVYVDPLSHALVLGSERVPLTPTEFRLVARLLAHPGTVVRRRQLVESGWPGGALVSDNTLDQYISKLRRKLARSGSEHVIEAARGVGYQLV
jgi:two-component system response regulator MprA